MAGYIYDLAQLVHQQRLAPVTIVAHSLGGQHRAPLRRHLSGGGGQAGGHRGARPARRGALAERAASTIVERMDEWIREQRGPRRPAAAPLRSIEDAFRRMQEENPHLSAEQARHLTVHGVNQNEDGTYSWKFDNYVRAWFPYDMRGRRHPAPVEPASPAPPSCSTARRAARRPRRGRPRAGTSATRAWPASTAPATGSTTTSWTSSSRPSASSWSRDKRGYLAT